MKNIFLTGATGFLGSYILKHLILKTDHKIFVLVREKIGADASERVFRALEYIGCKDVGIDRLVVVRGCIDDPSLGIEPIKLREIASVIDEIYHSAAFAEFRAPLDVVRNFNVEGTRNILNFAVLCKTIGRFKKIHHISTAFVSGTYEGVFSESNLNVGQTFNNTYEQSKYEAELLALQYLDKGLDVSIYRPSILTGDSVSGKTSSFKMFYQPLHFFAAEIYDTIPANPRAEGNLVTVDSAAEAICIIADSTYARNGTYHITNERTVNIGHFIDLASDYFGFKKPELIPYEAFDLANLTAVQRSLFEPFVGYFNVKSTFDQKNSVKILRKHKKMISAVDDDMLKKIFKFCSDSGFIKCKGRHVVVG